MLGAGYSLSAVVTCAVLMRSAGLDWGWVAGILAPLTMASGVFAQLRFGRLRRA